MNKIYSVILLLIASISLNSIELELNSNYLDLTGDFELNEIKIERSSSEIFNNIQIKDCHNTSIHKGFNLPIYSKLIALPNVGNYKISNENFSFREYQLEYNISPFIKDSEFNAENYDKNIWFPQDMVKISEPVIMRGNRFSQVSISPLQYNPKKKKIRILKDVNISMVMDNSITKNRLHKQIPSTSFKRVIEKQVLGAELPRDNNYGQYLFITPDAFTDDLQPLIHWKEKLGFKAKIATLSETGYTKEQIKDYLQNAYDNWEAPPEFVVLVGDESGTYSVPSFFVEGYYTPWDVTDHPYTLLDGDDYFPDIFIGRFSVHDAMELNTIISKIINYESDPIIETDWSTSALMISYVDNWNGYFSARETVMEVRSKLLNYEYTVVDTFISPYQSGSVSEITNMINEGRSFVNYRGAGGPEYWWGSYGPLYTSGDIYNLNNGFKLPMVTSITCGGGNFAYDGAESCFGELWLNAGSPGNPKGAIGFIGPSEIDTKTPFNNANDMGIYQGITQENLFRCGEMLLRGKMELYNNYPTCHGWGNSLNSDQFYFYVYNLLGDPGLSVWTCSPKEINFVFDDTLNSNMNYIEIEMIEPISDMEGFTIAITNQDSLTTTGVTDEDGKVNIPIQLQEGSYSVTASKYGFIPEIHDLTVTSNDIVGLADYNCSDVNSGEIVTINTNVQNFGVSTANNVNMTLSSNSDLVQILDGSTTLETLEPEELCTYDFQIQLDPLWKEGAQVDLLLNISSSLGDNDFLLPISISSPLYYVSEFLVENQHLIQNDISEINFEFVNFGSVNSEATTVELSSMSDNYSVINSVCELQEISVGDSSFCNPQFSIEIGNAISGEAAEFKLQVLKNEELMQELFYSYPIGVITEDSPTFSSYGYRAIESCDSGNFLTPEYNWIEIDPGNGGNGTFVTEGDDSDGITKTIDLPFEFTYFGQTYDKVSICTNGWMSMGINDRVFFRNRNIPSGVGSSAMIAPFWDNLIYGEVYSYYDVLENYFIIQWSDFKNFYSYQDEIFQVILYDPEYYITETGDGNIKFQYKEISNSDNGDNYATIGIENHSQTEGVLITFANIYPPTVHEISNDTAILFTTSDMNNVHNDDPIVQNQKIELYQNYPNPFNPSSARQVPSTTISFSLNEDQMKNARIEIYNLKGQLVKTLQCNNCGNGNNRYFRSTYSVVWDGTDQNNNYVSSGIYLYQLKVGKKIKDTRRMLLKK